MLHCAGGADCVAQQEEGDLSLDKTIDTKIENCAPKFKTSPGVLHDMDLMRIGAAIGMAGAQSSSFFFAQNSLPYAVLPLRIEQTSQTELSITWNDAHAGRYSMRHLRRSCPCAACRIEREDGGQPLLPILKAGEFAVSSIVPVGQYAVRLIWADGHDSGIYTYEYLRSLCECSSCSIPPGSRTSS